MKQRELIVKFILDKEKFDAGIKHANASLESFAVKATGSKTGDGKSGTFGKIGSNFSDMISSRVNTNPFGSAISGLSRGVSGLIPVVGAAAVAGSLLWGSFNAGMKAETTLTSLSVMTGSMSNAKKVYADVVDFAAKTPFMSEQASIAAKQLLAVKYSTDQLLPTMKMIGDVASGSGKDFNELISIMAKNKSSGIIQGEDLNQLIDAGIPIIDEFSKMFGKTGTEIRKMVSQSKIGYQDLETAFRNMTSAGGIYDDMMNKQSQTVAGLLSTIKDNAGLIFTYMSGILEPEGTTTMWTHLQGIVGNIGEGISGFVKMIRPFLVDLGVSFGSMFTMLSRVWTIVSTALSPAFAYIGFVVWGIVKAFNAVMFIVNGILGISIRLWTSFGGFLDRAFGITNTIRVIINEIKIMWSIVNLYIDIMIAKMEKYFTSSKNPFIKWIGKIVFDEEPAKEISKASAQKQTTAKQEQVSVVQSKPPQEWSGSYNQRQPTQQRQNNINNSRQSTVVNNVNAFYATMEETSRTATNLTGQPNIIPRGR